MAFKGVFLEIQGIPYMKKVTEFREIPRNYTTRNSAGILTTSARNTEQTEVKKTDGIPCRRNSVDTLPTQSHDTKIGTENQETGSDDLRIGTQNEPTQSADSKIGT